MAAEGVTTTRWTVRPVREDEFEAWTTLFRGYCDFYAWPTSEEHQRQIWGWIHDARTVEALVAVETDERGGEVDVPRGLAHLRVWVRPLRGVIAGYLDDLFVAPSSRGRGAVEALFDEINRLALERDWAVVRWTTAVDNLRAQRVYDRVATKTSWVTYDLDPAPTGLGSPRGT